MIGLSASIPPRRPPRRPPVAASRLNTVEGKRIIIGLWLSHRVCCAVGTNGACARDPRWLPLASMHDVFFKVLLLVCYPYYYVIYTKLYPRTCHNTRPASSVPPHWSLTWTCVGTSTTTLILYHLVMEWQYCPSVRISNHFPLSRRNDEKGSPITLLYHFLCRPLLLTTHNLKYYLSRTWYWAWGDIQLPCLLFFKYSEISWLVWPMALQLGNVLAFLSWLAKWVPSCSHTSREIIFSLSLKKGGMAECSKTKPPFVLFLWKSLRTKCHPMLNIMSLKGSIE